MYVFIALFTVVGVKEPTAEDDIVIKEDPDGVAVVEGVFVLLIVTEEEPEAVRVFELVIVAVSVFDFGPVIVIFIEADPDTETVDVLLGMFDFVFVIVLKFVGELDVVEEAVFDILEVAVVVGVKVDVLEPTEECVVLGEPVDVLDDVTVPVLVVVIIVVFVGLTEEEIEADPEEDLEAVTDFVLVGLPEAVLETGGVLL